VQPNLLATKLFTPSPRPNFIIRRRLLARLDESLSHKLTLVSAPAGFGKTTLLSIWASEVDHPVAWFSLDSDDDDPAVFLRYLIAALQTIAPEAGSTSLPLLQAPQPSGLESNLGILINELASIPQDFALILDDYHLIENQKIHAALTYLLDHLPPQMHLIISSRSDPPLQLSRLRARNQLLELRQSDLSMKAQETSLFLKQSMGLTLTEQQVEDLEARTEGWVAGLQLAALSLKGKDDIDDFIRAFGGSHRYIIDYLADEVFSQLPEDQRTFLIKTAILERFTAQLCDLITGRSDSEAVLRDLEDANLFLVSLDDRREWYRYHHLFLDYLRTVSDMPDEAELHKKAASWYLDHHIYSPAVKHAVMSQDTETAVQAISRAAPIAIQQAAFSNLFNWLAELPDQVVRENGELALYKSFALFLTQSYNDALPYALAAQENLAQDASSSLQGILMSLQAHMALYEGRNDDVIRLSRDALEYLDEGDYFFRNLTFNVLGQILETKGDVISAAEIYQQAFTLGSQSTDYMGTLVVFTNLVFSLNELGQREKAISICQEFQDEIGDQVLSGQTLSDVVSLSWSLLSYEADQLELASQQAQRALDTLERVGISQGISWAQYVLALTHFASGELDAMQELTHAGIQHAFRTGTQKVHGAWFTALEARASLRQGDIAAAQHWAEKSGYSPQDNPHHWLEHPYFTYTRLLLAQDRLAEARTLLNRMETNAQQGGRLRKLITINLLNALADSMEGNDQQIITRLETAVDLAAPQDYRRAFLDEGPRLLALLPGVRHIAPQFIDQLLGIAQPVGLSSTKSDELIESLTEREQEILQLVARGLSNREIADALFITLGTVKKHLNNIFSKLDVKSRTQAVARGVELHLLD
jgi:LuxR family maltose regulon positive regulatory protein